MRIDVYLTQCGIAKSRTVAQNLIAEGKISLNGKTALKASLDVSESDRIELCGELPKYVGRGGLKLEKAIGAFGLKLQGLVCVDAGASTGGFTDCMLQNGAARVYAVDVGHSQLDEKLRGDQRVVSLENLDIRRAVEVIPEKADFFSADLSFISLKLALPAMKELLSEKGTAVVLIKPQFEAGKRFLGKNGVIKDRKLQEKIAAEIKDFAQSLGFRVRGLVDSPVLGGDGNREFLMCVDLRVEK